jgi:hypothetical protein
MARPLAALCLAFGVLAPAARAEEVFALRSFASAGHVKSLELADFDGDGRGDLLEVAFLGLPPDEQREIRVRYQAGDGSFPEQPDWRAPLLPDAATYDLSDLDSDGAAELLLLRRDRITSLSLAGRSAALRDLALDGLPVVTVEPDERGLDRLEIARSDLGPAPRLLVPLFGEAALLASDGALLARLAVGGRANYYVPRKTVPLLADTEIEVYFDHPRMSSGDVDGDGLGDLVVSSRHEIRVFRQRRDHTFANAPDRVIPLRLLSESDHIRYTGSVRCETGNLDGDRRMDLVVSHTSGGIFDARSEARLFLNRGGDWNLDEPDRVIVERGSVSRNLLIDLDADGREELVHVRVPLGVLEVVEILLTRALDAEIALYRTGEDGALARDPFFSRKLDVPISLERQTSLGFVPTMDADLNGDGLRDLLDSGGGGSLVIHLGGGEAPYRERVEQEDVDTGGRVAFGDLDADGLTDLAIYDPRRPGAPIRLGLNRGVLPGTRRGASWIAPAED